MREWKKKFKTEKVPFVSNSIPPPLPLVRCWRRHAPVARFHGGVRDSRDTPFLGPREPVDVRSTIPFERFRHGRQIASASRENASSYAIMERSNTFLRSRGEYPCSRSMLDNYAIKERYCALRVVPVLAHACDGRLVYIHARRVYPEKSRELHRIIDRVHFFSVA